MKNSSSKKEEKRILKRENGFWKIIYVQVKEKIGRLTANQGGNNEEVQESWRRQALETMLQRKQRNGVEENNRVEDVNAGCKVLFHCHRADIKKGPFILLSRYWFIVAVTIRNKRKVILFYCFLALFTTFVSFGRVESLHDA